MKKVGVWAYAPEGRFLGHTKAADWCVENGIGLRLFVEAAHVLDGSWLNRKCVLFMTEATGKVYGSATNRYCVDWCKGNGLPLLLTISAFRPQGPPNYNSSRANLTDAQFANAAYRAWDETGRYGTVQVENEWMAGSAAYTRGQIEGRARAVRNKLPASVEVLCEQVWLSGITGTGHLPIRDEWSNDQAYAQMASLLSEWEGCEECWRARGSNTAGSGEKYAVTYDAAIDKRASWYGFFIGHDGLPARLAFGSWYYTTAFGDGDKTHIAHAYDRRFSGRPIDPPIDPEPQPPEGEISVADAQQTIKDAQWIMDKTDRREGKVWRDGENANTNARCEAIIERMKPYLSGGGGPVDPPIDPPIDPPVDPPPPDDDLISEAEQRAFSAVYESRRLQWERPAGGVAPIAIQTKSGQYTGSSAVECYQKWKAAEGAPVGNKISRVEQQAWLDFRAMKFPVAVRLDDGGRYHAEAGHRATGSGDKHQEVPGFVAGVEVLKGWGA